MRGFHEVGSGCILALSLTGEFCLICMAAPSEMSVAKKRTEVRGSCIYARYSLASSIRLKSENPGTIPALCTSPGLLFYQSNQHAQ